MARKPKLDDRRRNKKSDADKAKQSEANKQLRALLRKHLKRRGCFRCGKNFDKKFKLEAAHIDPRLSGTIQSHVTFAVAKNRSKKQETLKSELSKCGILCGKGKGSCHRAYDRELNGHAPVRWKKGFVKNGPKKACWSEYLRDYASLSAELEKADL